VPFFSISGSDFVEMFVGVAPAGCAICRAGEEKRSCIVFIDEIDAVGRHRGAGLGGGHDEREQTLNQLLVEMDGFEIQRGRNPGGRHQPPRRAGPGAAAPRPFRPARVVGRPDVQGREAILRVHTKKIPLSDNVDLSVLGRGTPGLAAARPGQTWLNEAALQRRAPEIARSSPCSTFETAKDKILMGAERKSLILSDAEKRNTAYHEAGHALVAAVIRRPIRCTR